MTVPPPPGHRGAHHGLRRTARVLVVDDEPHIAELMQLWFEQLGWQVATASTGPEGVARAAVESPDVVLLDLMLPGYGGLEVLRRLRRLDPTVVVVASTGLDSAQDRAAALAAGADDYLVKPCSLVDLEERLRELLAQRPRRGTVLA